MSQERPLDLSAGWAMLVAVILGLLVAVVLFIGGIAMLEGRQPLGAVFLIGGIMLFIASLITTGGFIILLPNEAALLTLFGSYRGTTKASGFWWTNPFMAKRKISLRSRNLEGSKLKVNDKQGNPIEIAVVVVWSVEDTAQACFDVEDYEQYVRVQSESAVRHLANSYAYDHTDDIDHLAAGSIQTGTSSTPIGRHSQEITLRSGVEEVSAALREELQERLAKAGVHVEEARLTHLAYAPEIAQAMLRRQQAEAVIAARQKIVHGAVSMVQMALHELSEKNVVVLDEERKAAMVSNLLVVLCGEAEVHPVINAGTLYN